MRIIKHGAEAILYLVDNKVIKERIKKGYRIKELDERLRNSRTKREAKLLTYAAKIINVPKVLYEKDNKIEMEFIKGDLLKNVLEKNNYVKLSKEIGKKIAVLHNNDIIHGDLTTSNMILSNEIYFIDFGLSFFSRKVEDKAVDLHLLKQALESKHYKIWEKCFKAALQGYKFKSNDSKEVIKRLEVVEGRGRYKGKK